MRSTSHYKVSLAAETSHVLGFRNRDQIISPHCSSYLCNKRLHAQFSSFITNMQKIKKRQVIIYMEPLCPNPKYYLKPVTSPLIVSQIIALCKSPTITNYAIYLLDSFVTTSEMRRRR